MQAPGLNRATYFNDSNHQDIPGQQVVRSCSFHSSLYCWVSKRLKKLVQAHLTSPSWGTPVHGFDPRRPGTQVHTVNHRTTPGHWQQPMNQNKTTSACARCIFFAVLHWQHIYPARRATFARLNLFLPMNFFNELELPFLFASGFWLVSIAWSVFKGWGKVFPLPLPNFNFELSQTCHICIPG